MGNQACRGNRNALRWGLLGAGAALASAVGYVAQRELAYVSKPAWVGEIEFYGDFAGLGVLALLVGAVAAWPPRGRRTASPWGWLAVAAMVVSALGYIVQTVLDHVYAPPIVGRLEFYGAFVAFACLALLTGATATVVGRRRSDLTLSLAFVALAYVLFAQVTQSLWD